MQNTSSTSSSRACPHWGVVFVALIIATEMVMAWLLPGRFFSHEVDRALYRIEKTTDDAELLFIGDSVGRQLVLEALKEAGESKPSWTNLATNQTIEMAGNYYFLKRYLRRHKKPLALVYVGGPPERMDLEGPASENFIQRCFLRWDEIAELAYYKGFRFACVMLVHRFMPSYRYRYHLQTKLLGHSNASIYFGVMEEADAGGVEGGEAEDGETGAGDAGMSPRIDDTLYGVYFKKLLDLLTQERIAFYYIFPPVSETKWSEREDSYRALRTFLESLQRPYRAFRYMSDLKIFPDRYFKKDGFHFQKGAARVQATFFLLKDIDLIQRSLE